jgi:hypothetical protein
MIIWRGPRFRAELLVHPTRTCRRLYVITGDICIKPKVETKIFVIEEADWLTTPRRRVTLGEDVEATD